LVGWRVSQSSAAGFTSTYVEGHRRRRRRRRYVLYGVGVARPGSPMPIRYVGNQWTSLSSGIADSPSIATGDAGTARSARHSVPQTGVSGKM